MADIGSTLREARIRARIDISEVEAATKIRAKYLRALENEEWDLLPGPIYTKSFLRTYGNFLGLDSRMLADEFRQQYEGPSEHELRPVGPLARERERPQRPRFPPWASIALVAAVLVGVLYLVGSATTSNPAMPAGHGHSPHARRAGHHPHKSTLPVTPATPKTVTLRLAPTGTVYVCLVNGAGNKLINAQIFNVGQSIPMATAHKLLLTLGNNSAQVKVNGRSVPVAPSSNAIRLLLTPSGVRHIPLSQTPTCP